jgi:hypothetical protein
LAFALSVLALAYWTFVGYALTGVLAVRRPRISNLLLAPLVGISALILLLYSLNVLGVPVRYSAWPATLGLFVLAVVLLWARRPGFEVRRAVPFVVIILAGLMLLGWPMLRFGFGWLSFGNDDMANYCVGATRFLEHGWGDPVQLTDVVDGNDVAQGFWFAYVQLLIRSRGDLLMDWMASLPG